MSRAHVNMLAALICGMFLFGCGGSGGNGGGGTADNRLVTAEYQSSQTTTVSDTTTNTKLTFGPGSLQSSGQITVRFSEDWGSKRPASPALAVRTFALLTAGCSWGDGDIVLVHTPASGTSDKMFWVWSLDGSVWHSVSTTGAGTATATLSASVIRAAETRASGSSVVRFGIVEKPYMTEATNTSLTRLVGDGPEDSIVGDKRTLILVHGFLNTPDDMKAAASYLVSKEKLFDVAYGYGYPSCRPMASNAAGLVAVFRTIPEGAKVTVIAYSMGGLVASFALEQSQENLWKKLDLLALVGTPRQGTNVAKAAELPRAIIDDRLNNPDDNGGGWFDIGINIPSVAEMVPGSNFMSKLCDHRVNHGLSIPYVLIGGQHSDWSYGIGDMLALRYYPTQVCDGLVPSASLMEYPYSQVTRGAVARLMVPYNHGEIIRKDGALLALANQIRLVRSATGPTQSFTSDTGDWKATNAGWGWTATLENHGGMPFYVRERVLQTYNREGYWVSDQWYDPAAQTGQIYPGSPCYWGLTLPAGAREDSSIFSWFGPGKPNYDDAPPESHAMTVVITDLGESRSGTDTFPFAATHVVTLLDKNGSPPNPPTRAAIEKGVDRAVRHLSTGRVTPSAASNGRSGR